MMVILIMVLSLMIQKIKIIFRQLKQLIIKNIHFIIYLKEIVGMELMEIV